MNEKIEPNGYGIASMVLGICSIIFCWIPVIDIALGILAIIFAVVQKKKNPNGIAVTGMVTGIIGLVFSIIYMIFYVVLIGAMSSL